MEMRELIGKRTKYRKFRTEHVLVLMNSYYSIVGKKSGISYSSVGMGEKKKERGKCSYCCSCFLVWLSIFFFFLFLPYVLICTFF